MQRHFICCAYSTSLNFIAITFTLSASSALLGSCLYYSLNAIKSHYTCTYAHVISTAHSASHGRMDSCQLNRNRSWAWARFGAGRVWQNHVEEPLQLRWKSNSFWFRHFWIHAELSYRVGVGLRRPPRNPSHAFNRVFISPFRFSFQIEQINMCPVCIVVRIVAMENVCDDYWLDFSISASIFTLQLINESINQMRENIFIRYLLLSHGRYWC